jgi:Protein of unknown function (DUF1501)/Protein of unknown function (DUF1549)/Planctomycete cytochrome C
MRSPLASLTRTFSSLALSAMLSLAAEPKGPVSFNRDIRPIMSDTCFRCHGPDRNARIAGLRLDIREEAIKATKTGIIPIVPGNPEQSAVIARVFAKDPALLMPPEYAHKELTSAQKEILRRWVAEGAKYEGHWAYEPVKRPSMPEIPNAKGPIRNPIDFIQARLMSENLPPSAEADRRTLIRRVTLDLTGLPPTTEELEAFLKDDSPDAYEKMVDRLLASMRYAEKQALHWLDAVRYADTSGFHGDNPFPAWPYRDHGGVKKNVAIKAEEVDKATAALILDLKQRGILEETLVVWGGEFGRTPMSQGDGRDHHIKGFSYMLAGGGIKGGITHGSTDELGYAAQENPVSVADFHATMLHLLGIDHRRLSVKFQGLDARLTGIAGYVVKEILV